MLKINELKLLAEMTENAEYGLLITNEVGDLFYENNSFSSFLKIKANDFLQQFPPAKTQCPFIFRNRVINKSQFFYGIKLCYAYYVSYNEEHMDLINENNGMKQILEDIDNGVILSDAKGIITVYNKSHGELDGLSPDEVLGKHLLDVYSSEQHSKVLASKEAIHSKYHHYITGDNRDIFCVTGTYPLIDKISGEIIGVYSVERDISVIQKLLQRVTKLEEEVTKNSVQNNTAYTFQSIIGESDILKETIESAKVFANSQSPVLIYGETGTGKELFAQSIHNQSANLKEPFVALNCGAVPENLIETVLFGSVKGAYTGAENQQGLFLSAKKGTLFLDEINSMPLSMQTKLLRALQERKVRPVGSDKELPIHCRIISSCNVLPEECLENGIFRRDLFYRLAIMRINIPPLHLRGNDILMLANHFAKKYVNVYRKKFTGFADDFVEYIKKYPWPGNVRELEFTIEGCIALLKSDETQLCAKHLPSNLQNTHIQVKSQKTFPQNTSCTLSQTLLQCEKNTILSALENNDWNITKTAQSLNIHRQNLQYRIRKLNIKKQ
ncbi:MAG: sigma 54-interacting transcriptional regulator [Clostridiales bacterium]